MPEPRLNWIIKSDWPNKTASIEIGNKTVTVAISPVYRVTSDKAAQRANVQIKNNNSSGLLEWSVVQANSDTCLASVESSLFALGILPVGVLQSTINLPLFILPVGVIHNDLPNMMDVWYIVSYSQYVVSMRDKAIERLKLTASMLAALTRDQKNGPKITTWDQFIGSHKGLYSMGVFTDLTTARSTGLPVMEHGTSFRIEDSMDDTLPLLNAKIIQTDKRKETKPAIITAVYDANSDKITYDETIQLSNDPRYVYKLKFLEGSTANCRIRDGQLEIG